MRAIRIASAFSFALVVEPSRSAVISGSINNPATGHGYYLLSHNTWTASESEATSLGGHLVTINDSAENQWVYDTFAPLAISHDPQFTRRVHLWIGFSDAAVEGNFTWASGEPVSFTHWETIQPNNNCCDQDYVHIRGPVTRSTNEQSGFWNDFYDEATTSDPYTGYFGVVEVVPEPSSSALLASVAGGFVLLRRRRTNDPMRL